MALIFRYAGYIYDEESQLYNLNARFYDAKLARFMQEDTYLGNGTDPLSLNLYTYCFNNPLKYYDPSGHLAIKLTSIVTTIAVVTAVAAGGLAYSQKYDSHNAVSTNDPANISGTSPGKPVIPGQINSVYATPGTTRREKSPSVNEQIYAMKLPEFIENVVDFISKLTDTIIPDLAADLSQGSKNDDVKALQERLNELGYKGKDGKSLTVDGDFGVNTLYAVNKYKNDSGLWNEDQYAGVVGVTT